MSKRARITLNPEVGIPPNRVGEAVRTQQGDAPAPKRTAWASSPRAAAAPPPKKPLSTGTLIKVVLAGVAVMAVVLLLKGRKI